MFSIPGWSVSESALTTQTLSRAELSHKAKKVQKARAAKERLKVKKNASEGNQVPLGKQRRVNGLDGGNSDIKEKKMKKEKKVAEKGGEGIVTVDSGLMKDKAMANDKGIKVTDENLQQLYEMLIEGKTEDVHCGNKKRKRGKRRGDAPADRDGTKLLANEQKSENQESTSNSLLNTPRKKRKKDKKMKETLIDEGPKSVPPPILPLKSTSALTPLQQKMHAKLTSARFRHLNEALYTSPSQVSFELFRNQSSMFHDYHAGFRQQVQAWPENPVDILITQLLSRASVKAPSTKKPQNKPYKEQLRPLPRPPPSYTCTIADLGCGDAKIAATLTPISKQRNLNLKIHSFDLTSSGNPLVTEADIAHLPLDPESIDVTILCLALMGTNYLDFIEEAFRVLRFGGELWIVEIKSRFTTPSSTALTTQPSSSSAEMGNKGRVGVLKTIESSGDIDEFDLAGGEESPQPTHSSGPINPIYTPFISALSRRGFILRTQPDGSPMFDDHNKMFVRMELFKPRPKLERPKPGEGHPDYNMSKEGHGGRGGGGMAMVKRGKWLVETEEDIRKREEKLLKPCVYKLR